MVNPHFELRRALNLIEKTSITFGSVCSADLVTLTVSDRELVDLIDLGVLIQPSGIREVASGYIDINSASLRAYPMTSVLTIFEDADDLEALAQTITPTDRLQTKPELAAVRFRQGSDGPILLFDKTRREIHPLAYYGLGIQQIIDLIAAGEIGEIPEHFPIPSDRSVQAATTRLEILITVYLACMFAYELTNIGNSFTLNGRLKGLQAKSYDFADYSRFLHRAARTIDGHEGRFNELFELQAPAVTALLDHVAGEVASYKSDRFERLNVSVIEDPRSYVRDRMVTSRNRFAQEIVFHLLVHPDYMNLLQQLPLTSVLSEDSRNVLETLTLENFEETVMYDPTISNNIAEGLTYVTFAGEDEELFILLKEWSTLTRAIRELPDLSQAECIAFLDSDFLSLASQASTTLMDIMEGRLIASALISDRPAAFSDQKPAIAPSNATGPQRLELNVEVLEGLRQRLTSGDPISH